MAADETKIKAMVHRPRPTNIRKLKGFFGLTGYYCLLRVMVALLGH